MSVVDMLDEVGTSQNINNSRLKIKTASIQSSVKMNQPVCLHLCHIISFNLIRSQSGTIKVYEPEIVFASQFCLVEIFNLAVIKRSVYACRHN